MRLLVLGTSGSRAFCIAVLLCGSPGGLLAGTPNPGFEAAQVSETAARGAGSEARPARQLPGRLDKDLRDIARSPATMTSRSWRNAALSAALVAALHGLDDEARLELDPASQSSSADEIRLIGREGAAAFLAASWLAGRASRRPKFTAIARDGVEAGILSAGIFQPVLAQTTGRARPRKGLGSEAFGTSQGSLPSGEVTFAFSVASVVASHSDRKWVDAAAWTLATATAWQRMEVDAHWLSDVGAGALLGAATGRWIVRRNLAAWSVDLVPEPRGASLAIRRTFPASLASR